MEYLIAIRLKKARFYYEQRITDFSVAILLDLLTPTYFYKQFRKSDFANGLSGTLSRSSEMVRQPK